MADSLGKTRVVDVDEVLGAVGFDLEASEADCVQASDFELGGISIAAIQADIDEARGGVRDVEVQLAMSEAEEMQEAIIGVLDQACDAIEDLEVRDAIRRMVRSNVYDKAQLAATMVSVFGEPIYKFGASTLGLPVDEGVCDVLRVAPTAAFGANLLLKTIANGWKHFKEPEAWIDFISILAQGVEALPIGNARLARLAKATRATKSMAKAVKAAKRVSRSMRASNLGQLTSSLEDKTVEDIGKLITTFMVIGLAASPLVVSFDELDHTKLEDFLREMGFDGFVIAAAKGINFGVRKIIQRNYTATLDSARGMIVAARDEYPELAPVLDNVLTRGGDEITMLLATFLKVLTDLKHMINPVDEDMELNEHGEIMTKSVEAVCLVTDLRNFTNLSEALGDDIFPLLKHMYFSKLKLLVRTCGGKILNHTGDGLVIYCTDKLDANGEIAKKKEDLAFDLALQLDELTNEIAAEFAGKKMPGHFTGVGIAPGTIRIGDALSMTREGYISKNYASGHDRLMKVLDRICPGAANTDKEGGAASLVGIGRPINKAARLESQAKNYPEHNCFITDEFYEQLSPEQQARYQLVGRRVKLKGIDELVNIYGIPRKLAKAA